MMTKAEHLAWCRRRALEYVEVGDYQQAISSLMSDLGKHPETQELPHRLAKLAIDMMLGGGEMVRIFIDEVTL